MADSLASANLQVELAALVEMVLAVDVRAYESMPPDQLARELEPRVSKLLAKANALVANVLEQFGGTGGGVEGDPLTAPYAPFERAIDAALEAPAPPSGDAVGDIAFLAHLELRQRAERLGRVTACRNTIAIVGECDSALRRIRKALTSIDVVIARARSGKPSFDFASELEVSLRVRRACAKLRTRVLAAGDPTPATLHLRLRSAGTAIAMLVGWEIYPSLRVRDGLQLRELQRRILDWLRHEQDTTAGLRLWQDLVAFIRMLAHVNRRQELTEHDVRVVRDARARLGTEPERLSDGLLKLLGELEGLDDEVDQLLASPARAERERWRRVLDALAGSLRGAMP